MANTTAGTLWNLPNLDGLLFCQSGTKTPFIDNITKIRVIDNNEFSMSSNYAHDASLTARTETETLTAPTAKSFVRANEKNVVENIQTKISLSYKKISSSGKMKYIEVGTSGAAYSTSNGINPVQSELLFQRKGHLEHIRRTMEDHFLQQTYNLAETAGGADQTRGIVTACTVNTIDAGGAAINKSKINALVKEMFDNNAPFGDMVLFVGSYSKTKVSNDYAFVTQSRTEGGEAIGSIMTDFCNIRVIANPFITASTVLLADMSQCGVVFQPVPGKDTASDGSIQYVVWEPLSKTGAGEDWQLYLQAGIDYGSAYFHGSITNLATA
jgi:hypothetical protein